MFNPKKAMKKMIGAKAPRFNSKLDYDGDGLANYKDCAPLNKRKQGPKHSRWRKATNDDIYHYMQGSALEDYPKAMWYRDEDMEDTIALWREGTKYFVQVRIGTDPVEDHGPFSEKSQAMKIIKKMILKYK